MIRRGQKNIVEKLLCESLFGGLLSIICYNIFLNSDIFLHFGIKNLLLLDVVPQSPYLFDVLDRSSTPHHHARCDSFI